MSDEPLPPRRGGEHQTGPVGPYYMPTREEVDYIREKLDGDTTEVGQKICKKIDRTREKIMVEMREPAK